MLNVLLLFPSFNITFVLTQDDASQENNMQAEVTGKLKQHFNNTLPKQNNTSAGVSVIMVSEIKWFYTFCITLHHFSNSALWACVVQE